MMTSSLFSESVPKTCQRQSTELKLSKLIVDSKFHKICKFENHVTRNDVIMMSLPKTMEKQWGNADLRETKQIIYQSKGIDESYPKMNFLLNLNYYVKVVGILVKFWHYFAIPAHQIWSYDMTQEANFKNFLFCPNFTFNIRKRHKISSTKALYFRSYQPKTSPGLENTPL